MTLAFGDRQLQSEALPLNCDISSFFLPSNLPCSLSPPLPSSFQSIAPSPSPAESRDPLSGKTRCFLRSGEGLSQRSAAHPLPAKSRSSLPAHVSGAGVRARCRISGSSAQDDGGFKWSLGMDSGGKRHAGLRPGTWKVQAVQGEEREELPAHKYLPFPWEGSAAAHVALLLQRYVTSAGECFHAFGGNLTRK